MRAPALPARARAIFRDDLHDVRVDTDRVFLWLLLIQWAAAIAVALFVSPYAWAGRTRTLHVHVEIAVFGGAILNLLPITLMILRPASTATRHTVAITQMLWAALFVHLTGGRIETHFHIFGSLAFLSFYRDPRLLITATLVVAADHLLLGFYWPESVYGIANPEWWRFAEHAGWVFVEDVVLWLGGVGTLKEMRILAEREATLEESVQTVEHQVQERTEQLRTSAERYRSLIENTSAVPWEIDRETLATRYLAPQMRSIFGVSQDDPGSLIDHLHPDDRDAFRRFLRERTGPTAPGDTPLYGDTETRGAARVPGDTPMSGDAHDRSDAHIDSRILNGDRLMHVRSFVAERRDGTASDSICGISIDMTQQKKLEVELLQAQKLESIGQLSAGIAHEINTPTQFIGDNIRFLQEAMGEIFALLTQLKPLAQSSRESALSSAVTSAVPMDGATPMAGVPEHGAPARGTAASVAPMSSAAMADLLSRADLPYLEEEIPKAIAQSLEGVARISKIVGAMKEFSHPAIDRTLYDLNRAIASTITVASNEWKYVADIETSFDASLPQVTVMPGAFNQVILNIIVNAAHAIAAAKATDAANATSTAATDVPAVNAVKPTATTPPAKGTIRVTTHKIDDWAEVRISDTGCGIPEKIRDRIFDPFFTTKPVGKGTGQGLAIAHDVICKKHRGTISVESTPGQGTTFIVRIPIAAADTAAAVAA